MVRNPLHHVIGFWKPVMDDSELDELARYTEPDVREPGINVWRSEGGARPYHVLHGPTRFSLFADVHPIEAAPDDAEIIAEIQTVSGEPYSYVLWFPSTRSLILPFDPVAAIEAFWYEQHAAHVQGAALPRWAFSLYYAAVRPLMHPDMRHGLRRIMAKRAYAKDRILDWPSDVSLDRLQRFLLGLLLIAAGRRELQFGWFWPEKREFAAVLTHDVETAEGLDNVGYIADMERERGLRSSFNVVPFDYPLSWNALRPLQDEGFELGVHGYTHDGVLFSSWGAFAQRVSAVNEFGRRLGASGFRSPCTYRNLEWFNMLEFDYDSSVSDTAPFEPQPGGCASLFPYEVCSGVMELPITLPQDHTLFGLLNEKTAQTWLTKLHEVRQAHGMACVLTHPDPSTGYVGLPRNGACYRALLDAIVESGAWTPLPGELAAWWRSRAETRPADMANLPAGSLGHVVLASHGTVEIKPPNVSPAIRRSRTTRIRRPIHVWIDMANSPHVQFFGPTIREIESRGHTVTITARDYAQTVGLLEHAGLGYTAIGHHGGKSRIGKLMATESRARGLVVHARERNIDVAVHHNSYAQAVAAYSLGIPSVTLMDYEFQPANHIGFRLSDVVLVPEAIPRRSLDPYGGGWRLRRYPGLKEDFYAASMIRESSEGLAVEGLDDDQPLLVLRPPPDIAAYHPGNTLWVPLLEYLSVQNGVSVLVLPRTEEQAWWLARQVSGGLVVADHAIAPAPLLRHADAVITAGGTMAREAASLNIPAYTLFAGRRGGVDDALIRDGRLKELASEDDFKVISFEKNPRREPPDLEREQERVRWLVDLIEETSNGR